MKQHGDTDKMVTSKIEQLNESDLDYLEHLLQKEFSRQTEYSTIWKSKNHYDDPSDKTRTIARLLEAVRSQKRVLTMPKW